MSLKRMPPGARALDSRDVRISEDFPAPFAPTIATISPRGTSSDTAASACASP
jgi:hypothetical protein